MGTVEAELQRSTDQVRWTTVRGALALSVSLLELDKIHDDYEFTADTLNHYRLICRDAGGVETGTQSATITPDLA
ncbi:MAG: hypothetical protein ACRDXB_14095, partial [Actinomycetes bacterium]